MTDCSSSGPEFGGHLVLSESGTVPVSVPVLGTGREIGRQTDTVMKSNGQVKGRSVSSRRYRSRRVVLLTLAVTLAACSAAAVNPHPEVGHIRETTLPPRGDTTRLTITPPAGVRAVTRDPQSGVLSGPIPEHIVASGQCEGIGSGALESEGWVASDFKYFDKPGPGSTPSATASICLTQLANAEEAGANLLQVDAILSSAHAGSAPEVIPVPGAVEVVTRDSSVRVAFGRGKYVVVIAVENQATTGASLVALARSLAMAQYERLGRSSALRTT